MPALSLQLPLCHSTFQGLHLNLGVRPALPALPQPQGDWSPSPPAHQQAHGLLWLTVSGQIEATIGKTRLQQCAPNCWCFCGTLAIRNLQRGTVKAKEEKWQERKWERNPPWLQTSRRSRHFVACTVCSSHAPGPITSFQTVINPLGPQHTCNLRLG